MASFDIGPAAAAGNSDIYCNLQSHLPLDRYEICRQFESFRDIVELQYYAFSLETAG